jgi:hypothetical protein
LSRLQGEDLDRPVIQLKPELVSQQSGLAGGRLEFRGRMGPDLPVHTSWPWAVPGCLQVLGTANAQVRKHLHYMAALGKTGGLWRTPAF